MMFCENPQGSKYVFKERDFPQKTYSGDGMFRPSILFDREGSGFLGYVCSFRDCLFQVRIPSQTHGSVENRAPLKLEILVSFRTGTQNWQIVEG